MIYALLLSAALTLAAAERGGLEAVKAEPNLEKRSRKALDYAEHALKAAREANRHGEPEKIAPALEEVREAVQLAFESLQQTGKNPRKSPKHFKHAEIETRKMLRALADFRIELSVDQRGRVEEVERTVLDVHDRLLSGIMQGWEDK